jgi:hypothetical protein
MNTNIDMAYLSGGDDYFGPGFGGATVYTIAPNGYMIAGSVASFLPRRTVFLQKGKPNERHLRSVDSPALRLHGFRAGHDGTR